ARSPESCVPAAISSSPISPRHACWAGSPATAAPNLPPPATASSPPPDCILSGSRASSTPSSWRRLPLAEIRTHAQVLLKLSEGGSLTEVCRAFAVCRNTVRARPCIRFAEGDVDAVLSEGPLHVTCGARSGGWCDLGVRENGTRHRIRPHVT